MTRPNRLALGAYGVAAAIIVLDQLSKAWILYGLHLREVGRIELSPIFDLSFVLNTGVSFGLFSGGEARWALTLFSIAVAVVLALWVRQADRRLFAAAVALIIGGALGNVIDRVWFGYVVDFIHFHWNGRYFPAFNVADSAITIGAVCLLIDAFREGGKKPQQNQS